MINIKKTVVITTESAVDRRVKLVENMRRINFHDVLPVPQSWFYGDAKFHDFKPVPIFPRRWDYSIGAWYCREAHRTVLQQFVNESYAGEYICVMEDDCVFAESFIENTKSILSFIHAGFDVLMLGGQHLRGQPAARDFRQLFCRINNPVNRLHCYIVSFEGAKKCLRLIESDILGLQVDDIIGYAYPQLEMFAAIPFVVGQSSGVSQTSGCTVMERFWN